MRFLEVVNYVVTSAAWFFAGVYGRAVWDNRVVRDARR